MLTILLVDDDADLRCAMSAVLEDAGYQVVQAEDGVQALAALEREPADFAIVDVMMPVMDGLQLFDQVRAGTRCPRLPMLLVTASRLNPTTLAGRDVPLLLKPVTPAALLEAIARILRPPA